MVALRVVKGAILCGDGVEFSAFLGATDKPFEEATMPGEKVVMG
jgi:hypothetical protein